MEKGFVYILLSGKDKKSYIGSTKDLSKRTQEHFSGKVLSTKYRRPLRFVYSEEYGSLSEAIQREKYLKTRSGRKELRRIFERIKL